MVTCAKKHFQLTFENGLTVIAEIGENNYCSRVPLGREYYDTKTEEKVTANYDCELSIYDEVEKKYITPTILRIIKFNANAFCGSIGWVRADELADIINATKNYRPIREVEQ